MEKLCNIIPATNGFNLELHFIDEQDINKQHRIQEIPIEQISKVFEIITEYIDKTKIKCAEDVYQNEEITLNSYEFIDSLCEAMGYYR